VSFALLSQGVAQDMNVGFGAVTVCDLADGSGKGLFGLARVSAAASGVQGSAAALRSSNPKV
jgi:hypothetical protein